MALTDLNLGFTKETFDPNSSPAFDSLGFDPIYKEYYQPAVRDLLNNKRVMMKILGRRQMEVAGKFWKFALNIGRNESSNFIAEGGRLPKPGRQQYDEAQFEIKHDYLRILLTGPAVSASRNNRGAYIRVFDAEVRAGARDKLVENNRVVFGDGTGYLCEVTAESGTTYTVANPGGFANPGPGTQYLRTGMRVAAIDTNTAGGGTLSVGGDRGFYVLSVDYSANTATFAQEGSSTATAITGFGGATGPVYLVKATETTSVRNRLDTGWFNEAFGIAACIDEGNLPPMQVGGADTLFGEIDADVTQAWNSAVDDPGSIRPFNQDMLQRALDLVDIQGDGTVGVWMGSHGIRRAYFNDLVANNRYIGTMTYDGGFKALEYNGIPFVVDKDCTRGRIYGIDPSCIFIAYETDYAWMDADGSILNRVPDTDAYEATMYRYWQVCTDARNRHVVVKNILDN